jgi:uncharacterized membrane protein YcaP (DUF421 family)
MAQLSFDGWSALELTLAISVCAYLALPFLLHLSGERTLLKMNAFDLVVTVAVGSMLATILISQDAALVHGVLAFAMLLWLQFAIIWSRVRAPWVRSFLTREPTLLWYQGELLSDALRRVLVTESEVRAAVRLAGVSGTDDVAAVVLETDGSLSVVRALSNGVQRPWLPRDEARRG